MESNIYKCEESGIMNLVDFIANTMDIYRTDVYHTLYKNGFINTISELDRNDKDLVFIKYINDLEDVDNINEDCNIISDGLFTFDIDNEVNKFKNILISKYNYNENNIDTSCSSLYIKSFLSNLKMDSKYKVNLEEVNIPFIINNKEINTNLKEVFDNCCEMISEDCLFEYLVHNIEE